MPAADASLRWVLPAVVNVYVGAGSHDDVRRLAATGTADADAQFAEVLGTCHTAVDVSFLWQVSTFESRYRPCLGSGGLPPASDTSISGSIADQFV
jgi:hypothetical protein